MSKFRVIRGFNDILPKDNYKWQYTESQIKEVLSNYNYDEARLPILEQSELFHRSVGESSDILLKETYDFSDRSGNSLTLRPEGTAGCVRMVIENSLINRGQIQKLWYYGPMFRYERPQKGRYRQFYQLGVEVYGVDSVAIDLEMISLAWNIFKKLKLSDEVVLELNNLGSDLNRQKYTNALLEYLEPYNQTLDSNSLRKLAKTPLRVFDSKIPQTQEILKNAPKLIDFVDAESLRRFRQTCDYVESLGIKYKVNKGLVRGLDYYGGLVFEWTTDKLGAQSAICAGGRYDNLVENLGGHKTSAIGFAIGMERLILLLEKLDKLPTKARACDVFFVLSKESLYQSLAIVDNIRSELDGLKFDMDLKLGSFKSQFKKADKSGAKIAIIIGSDELETRKAGIKYLQQDKPQQQINLQNLINFLESGKW